jgi:hypothetical protein
MDQAKFEKLSKLINLKNEIKSFHEQLNVKEHKLGVIDTAYDGPGNSYITFSNDLKIKIKELLFIIDQKIDEDIDNLYDRQ